MNKIILTLMMVMSIIFISVLNFPIVSSEESKSFYVSNVGDNSNDGLSPETAWRTIGKVNSEFGGSIQPGDNVFFRRGDLFTDAHLNIGISGVSVDNPIVIGAYGVGSKPLFEGRCIVINSVHNVTVEHIRIANISGSMIQVNSGSSYLTIQDIDGYKSSDHAIFFQSGCSHVIVRDCTINITHSGGNDIIWGSFSYGLIENNTFLDASHSTINLFRHPALQDEFVIIRNNTLVSPWRNLDTYMNNILIENNMIIWEDRGISSGAPEQFCGGNDIIIRDNYFLNGSRSFLHLRMTYESGGTQYVGGPMNRFSVYHNTFYTGDVMGSGSLFDWHGFIKIFINTADHGSTYNIVNVSVKNNIMSGIAADNCLSMYYIWPDEDHLFPVDNLFDTNLIYVNEGESTFHTAFRQGGLPSGYSPTDYIFKYDISQVQSAGWPNDPGVDFDDWVTYVDNVWVDPLLNDDFSLSGLSPAVDAGDWLTFTSGGGTSRFISVDNAQFFWPRLVVNGVVLEGDKIFVGDNMNLEVVSVDYENNVIEVDGSISYDVGDVVSRLSYGGSAPDVGAYEFNLNNQDNDYTSPIISEVNSSLYLNESMQYVNITCTVYDNEGLDFVKVNITDPSGSCENITMNGESNYFYNSTYSIIGRYAFFIYAEDTNNNSVVSSNYTFDIEDYGNTSPPEIKNLTFVSSDPIDTNSQFGWINISANIAHGLELKDVKLIINCSEGFEYNLTMYDLDFNYYYNCSDIFIFEGDYTYNVWVVDIMNNSNTSMIQERYIPHNCDINKDGGINLLDLTAISNKFGFSGPMGWIREDVNNDGVVDVLDLVLISNIL